MTKESFDCRGQSWAQMPNQFSRKLGEVKSNLGQAGIVVEIDKKNRKIEIQNKNISKRHTP